MRKKERMRRAYTAYTLRICGLGTYIVVEPSLMKNGQVETLQVFIVINDACDLEISVNANIVLYKTGRLPVINAVIAAK